MPRALRGLEGLLRDLNPAQREAVSTTEGPLLVLAGAGTGKTRVITFRIAHLLWRGTPPETVLGMTFTNKAAREMRERIASLLGGRKPRGLTLSTFHALGMRILREQSEPLGLRPNFSIQDSSDQVSLLRSILRDIRGATSIGDARAVLARISLAKNRFARPEDLVEAAADDLEYVVARAYARYQEALTARNSVDFDDLVVLPVRLLEADPERRDTYRRRFRYLLVDEYQDTNGAQYRFTRALTGPERNVCVVGDDDQSIYGFRGAELDKILRFDRDFPGARVVRLEDNYRSTGSILALANAVISVNPTRHPKRLRSTIGAGPPVRWVAVRDGDAEADFVVGEILRRRAQRRTRLEDVAILVRSAIQARPFEEKLRLRRIPYTLVGGQSLYDRKEIRDALAFWNVAHNPADDTSLLRIINTPRRGLGSTAVRQLDELARKQRASLSDVLERVAEGDVAFPTRGREGALHLARAFRRARELSARGQHAAMCRQLLEDVGYEEALQELTADPLALHARRATLEDLIRSVERWQEENPGEAFGAFLGSLALASDDDRREDSDARRGLTIQTLHSAKGLEYPTVFLVGLEEDLLPHRKALAEGDHAVEEERRLFYVGITRAREELILTSADSRRSYGRDQPRRPSRFLTELTDSTLVVREGYMPDAAAPPDEVSIYLEEYRRLREQQDG